MTNLNKNKEILNNQGVELYDIEKLNESVLEKINLSSEYKKNATTYNLEVIKQKKAGKSKLLNSEEPEIVSNSMKSQTITILKAEYLGGPSLHSKFVNKKRADERKEMAYTLSCFNVKNPEKPGKDSHDFWRNQGVWKTIDGDHSRIDMLLDFKEEAKNILQKSTNPIASTVLKTGKISEKQSWALAIDFIK